MSLPRARTTNRSPTGAALIDPEALMRIQSLELRARVVVEGFLHGLHRSPVHGFSVEFTEYRPYSPGDDPRSLDWRLYARTDRFYVKRFEDETNLRCYLVIDMSRSMAFGSLGYTKTEYARTAAATLAYFLWSQRDAVGLLTFDEDLREYLPPRYRPGHMHRLALALGKDHAGRGTDIGAPLDRLARLVTRRSLVVLVSDLLAPLDRLAYHLRLLTSRGHEVILLRILDPAEETFSFPAPALFEDLETGRELYVDPESARREYLRRHAEHTSAIERLAGDLGADVHLVTTDRPLELALFDFVASRQRRGRRVARRGSAGVAGRRSP